MLAHEVEKEHGDVELICPVVRPVGSSHQLVGIVRRFTVRRKRDTCQSSHKPRIAEAEIVNVNNPRQCCRRRPRSHSWLSCHAETALRTFSSSRSRNASRAQSPSLIDKCQIEQSCCGDSFSERSMHRVGDESDQLAMGAASAVAA